MKCSKTIRENKFILTSLFDLIIIILLFIENNKISKILNTECPVRLCKCPAVPMFRVILKRYWEKIVK